MNLFEIWSEGYVVTGNSAGAYYHGSIRAETFREACIKFAEQNSEFKKYFDSDKMTYWGCKLFNNGTDARKSFG